MILLSLVTACALGCGGPLASSEHFTLEPTSIPMPLLAQGKVDTVIEASGIQPLKSGTLAIVAHDKASPMHVLDFATGELVGDPITSPRMPKTSAAGPKWEGMARDDEGNFYAIGSHSGSDEERLARTALVRFRLKPGSTPEIDDASVTRWDLSASLVSALQAAGVSEKAVGKRKIEGLTIRETQGTRELIIGLRAPNDQVRAFSAVVSNLADGAKLNLKPVFAFKAGQCEGWPSELTSLEYAPRLKGFLAVTATEDDDNVFHGNTLWFIPDGETSKAEAIGKFEIAMKAEGLAVIEPEANDTPNTTRLVITYDNDAHKTHMPSRVQTFRLFRR